MGFTTVTFCAALLVLANAGPVYKFAATDGNACASTCSDNNKFNYKPGNVYEFSYNAKTTTKMNGASEDAASMNINAKVEIEPLTKCGFVMRIKDASLSDSLDDENDPAFQSMMSNPLQFSFQDGRIDHICAMDGESTWTLNIKRGILSAFQNSMDSFDRNQNLTETDVVGTCLSEYKVLSNNRQSKKVEKTKNLLGCSDREGSHMAVHSIGYNVPSFVKSLPLMKSEYKCTQTIDLSSNILQSSTCSEEHVFRPFSYGKNGAMTTSEQTLTFTNMRRKTHSPNGRITQRSTLLFQHKHYSMGKAESEGKIEAILNELCQKAAEDIRPEVPEMFNQMIEHMRQVDGDVLSRIYKKTNQKKFCPKADHVKQYFRDAIPMVGTSSSVGMIQDLISKKHVTGSEAEMWLLSLSFIQHPTQKMLVAAAGLLSADVSGNTMLAVSSIANSYCNVQPDCGTDSEISSLTRKLMELTNDCDTKNGDARKIVFALRALGNIGRSNLAVSHLARCYSRRDVPEEIRIAAMDAFRRVPCDAMRSDLMGVFRDESEDSELRLNAYIALMKCPSKTILSEVREVLEKEKSNQVGSFVWTHLTNLMETSDPHMQDIRNIVQDEELKKEFNLDQRKFSRNYEGSFFLDSINTGAKVDSNVIFSEKSFIPRSANLNLTIDLFGHAINFLEFGGRVQGMERILENFFSPITTRPSMKSKVPIDLDKSMDALRGSAFLRMFGNELRYWDDKSLSELLSSLGKLMKMQAISFSKSMQLLQSRMVIPTCAGFPLSLKVSATGSISIDAKASLEPSKRQLHVDLKPSASVQVIGEMSVDAHLTKAGLRMVTVAHTSTGAKIDISNNIFDLQIPQKKMDIFNLKTDFYIIQRNTEKKQKMIVDNVKKREICTGNSMKQVTGLTFCQNIKYPNASSHNEAPFFPFTGPVVYDLYMMNEDAPSGYQIEGFTKQSPYSFYIDTPNSKVSRRIALDTVMKNKHEAQITFTAPWKNVKIEGTVVNMDEMKKFTGKLSLNGRTDYTINAELGMENTNGLLSITPKFEITIPKNKMTYEGKIEMRPMKTLMIDMSAMGFIANDINLKVSGEIVPKEIGLTSQLRIGKKEYYIATRLGKLVTKSGFKYTPFLKITIPSKDLVEIACEISYESKKKMSFDFKLSKVLPKTVALNAIVLLNAGKTKTKNILKITFKSPRGNFKINGDLDNKKTGIISRVIGSYNFGAKYSDRLTLSSKIRNLSVKKSVRYMGNIALVSKKQQFLNFNLKGQLAKAMNHLETKFDLHYGNPKIKTNLIKFICVLNRALKPFSHSYDFTMAIQHPGQKINYKVEANHVQSAKWPFKKFENTVMVQMAPGKVVQTKVSYNNAKVKGLPTHESEIALSYPGRDMKITNKLSQVNKNMYENELTVQWLKGGYVVVQSTYTKTGGNIHNIKNLLTQYDKKEVKLDAILQVMPGSYKGKLQFAADGDIMTDEPFDIKAEGTASYAFNNKVSSIGFHGEVMLAPNQKISTTVHLDSRKNSLNGKLSLSTHFDALKNFESKATFTFADNKYSSMMSVSLNKDFELKQDFSLVYPNFHLSYDASAILSDKKPGVTLVIEMMELMPRAYKTIVRFAADRNIISKERIDFKTEGTVSYEFNDKAKTLSLHGEAMWAPNQNMSSSIHFSARKNNVSHTISISTPFERIKNLDTKIIFTLENNRYVSVMSVSWNKENDLKHVITFVYPDFTFAYSAYALLGGEKYRFTFGMKYNDTALYGAIIIADEKTTYFDIVLKHMVQKMSGKNEFGLEFDIFGSKGKMKATLEYDLRKGVLMSNGEGKLNLPLMQLRQIGASYNLKHNNDLTSIDMSYSSSLGNYRNGKVIIESRRNLPKMLKTKMDMTFNDKPLFNINANYGNQKDNIDMKIDIVEPSGQKITVSGNINLSGSRKTGNVELKSRYINLSADGAFEYQGTRSASGELKMTAEGKSVMIKANYKKEGSTYKVTGTLGLPDGRSLKMEGSLDLQNIAASLKTMSPDFPELTGIDMAFSFNGDNRMFSSVASLKVMPYLDTTQVEMKFTRKQFSIEMKSQFESMKQAKVTFTFAGEKVKAVFQLNNEKMVDLDMNYNFNSISDFVVSMTALTSHRRYKEFQFDLMNKGPLSNMQSSLKVKFANVLMLDAMFQNSRKISKISLDAQLLDFDEWKSTFELKGDLDAMTAKIITNIAKKEVNRIDVNFEEYGRSINIKVKGPKAVNLDFNMDLDTEAITFNMESSFTLNGHEKYDISASYEHLSKLQMKTSIPSYQNELLITFSGNLKAFNAQTKFSHNNQMYELMLSNKDYYRQVKGNLNTPYFKDTATFKFDGEFSAMNIFAQVMHNNDKYELTFSNKGYYQQIDAKLDTPFLQPTLKFALSGNLKKFNVELKIQFDQQTYEMKASNEAYFKQMNFLLDTPFLNCDFQFEGDLDNAKGVFTILYGKSKYELSVSNKNFFKDCSLTLTIPKHVLKVNGKMNIKKKATNGNFNIIYNKKKLSLSGTYKDLGRKKIVKADLTTPYFKDSLTAVFNGNLKKFNAQVKVIHNGETYEVTASNKNFYRMIDLNIYAPGMEAKLDFEGELKKFKSFASVKISKEMYRFGLSNDNYVRNIHIELTTPQTGNIMFGYDLQGELNSFNLTSQFSYRKTTYELNVVRDSKTGEHRLTIASPQINVNAHFNGDLKSFTFNTNAVFNNQKYEVMASTKNYFREMSGKLITPQFGEQSLSVKINGQLRDFSGSIVIKNNNDMYKSEFSLNNKELNLSLPIWLKKLQVKLNGNWKNFDFNLQGMNYARERFEISAINKNFQQMKAHLAIPNLEDIDVSFKQTGDLRNGEATLKISFGNNVFENKVEFSFDGRQLSFEIEPHYMILGRSGKAKLQMDLMFEAQSYKYEFEADIEGNQVKSTASVKISPETSVLMTVNLPTFEPSEMKLRIVSRGFQKIDMMLNLKSPWTGMTNIFYEHNGQIGKMFSTKGYVELDGDKLAGYSLNLSNKFSFDFKCEYSRMSIEINGDLMFQGGKTLATVSINTPFRVFKEFFASAQIKNMRDGQVTAELDVKLPNQQYSLNIDLGNGNFNALLNLNMDKKNKDKQYQFQTTYRNTDQRADVSRSFNFKMALPQRTVSLDSRFQNTQDSIVMTGDLIWDEAKDQKVGFKLMVQNNEQKEAKLQIITPRRTVEIFGRVGVNGNRYSTVGHIMMDENKQSQKVDINADMMISSDRADIDFTVKFPNQKKGMNLKTSINLPKGDLIFSSNSEFSMDQDPKKSFKMSTKVMSETKGKRQMYTLQMDAGHAQSGFATELVGRLSSTPEKYNADVEMGYLTLKNKQQKVAIRGEVHRLDREINLKLEAPSKTIELDGSLRNGNRYMVSMLKKETGKENMEALFKLNPNSQRMSIIINYDEANPNNLYRIDADVMKSKAVFQAYRINKQRKQTTDGRITAEFRTNSIFQSHIKWNPNLLEELNMYGYQKLTMYGKELRSFGDYLRQMLNDEVSIKFDLVKASFSKDLAPISDYFVTEYRSLSEDLTIAMHRMEQLYEQDSFYVKSAINAISNVWHETWINFGIYLTEVEQEIEVFNENMKNKMDEAKKQFDFYYGQYSMQLRSKVNKLFDFCQEQCVKLHESAMKMKAEIVSFIKNYPETIDELITRMRQTPYGEKVIVFLTEIYEAFEEKRVQAKEHMNTLTSSIYSAHATLNRHIASARRYPIVDAIVDAIDGVYQQVLWSYNYWYVKDNVLDLKNTLNKFGAKKIKEIKDIITDLSMDTLVFDPKRGEIIVEIRFGAAKYFYNHFMSSVEDLERAVMKLKNLMPSFNLNVWDIYYMLKPSSNIDDYIPPFKAEATLYAGKYITTFDGRHLIYKGTCSYLLAHDFVDGNFTVVANFDADTKAKTLKSLSVTTAHREQLEIFPNNKVTFNGRVAKLPLQLTDATVSLQSNVIVLESKRGYKVMFDHQLQLYSVQITGWYFNKVAGLFGNYNNEARDDMLMSNNMYTNDLEQFAQSWSVSKQCRSHRNVAPSRMVSENEECAHFFLATDSPFRYCFRQVNPDLFYKTCAMQLSSSKATSIELCNVSFIYQKQCEMKGVYLSTPIMCPKEM